jgi:hypothetical protein
MWVGHRRKQPRMVSEAINNDEISIASLLTHLQALAKVRV